MQVDERPRAIAYFSMEAGLEAAIPTYSGGLGVLAGDSLRAAADLALPVVAVTLLYRQGYFHQRLDAEGNQTANAVEWEPSDFLEEVPVRAYVDIEGRSVALRAWRYTITGVSGDTVPVYLLDANLPENEPYDQTLTGRLYGGDERYRLEQEVMLGIGGVAMLRELGYRQIETYHMNEGHCALLGVALLEEHVSPRQLADAGPADYEAVRSHCVFTSHTPVPAGHDAFPASLVRQVVGRERSDALEATGACIANGVLNMTWVALFFSRFVNGVSMLHGEVSQAMYPGYKVHAVTNGVHGGTWASEPFAELFDEHIPDWRLDNAYLRYAIKIPVHDVLKAHQKAKTALLTEIDRRTGVRLGQSVLTIGFARRAATYKRAALIFSDVDALREIVRQVGPIQFVFAGKAHPRDFAGQLLIRDIFAAKNAISDEIRLVYLEDHDMALGKLVCSGVDVWLNNPERPQEASGTSGMKAALNGVPSLSVLDGWWVEGCVEGITGWSIGSAEGQSDDRREARALYDKLRYVVLPLYYDRPEAWAQVMRSAIGLNGSFFNAQRMMEQYVINAYSSEAGHLIRGRT